MKVAKFLIVVLLGVVLPLCAQAQWDNNDTPLGDLARAMRKSATLPSRTVIDNDNFSQLMNEVESRRLTGGLRFSFDNLGKDFQVSGPDVTCSLSFTSQSSSLLSNPFVSRTLPDSELAKLDGPASIEDNNLQIAVFNGSGWELREITVGLTLVHKSTVNAAGYAAAKLVPAAEVERAMPEEKRSDQTVLYHIKGAAGPLSNAIFRAPLERTIAPDQEWHWAIVEAKGIPPSGTMSAPQ